MANYQESPAKQTTRKLLLEAAKHLHRTPLTYLGMPAEDARDIQVLRPLLQNAICIADKPQILEETRRNIAALPLQKRRFVVSDVWEYLRTEYIVEELVADVTFLDFYGGGLRTDNPFASEISGLRSYFAKHAKIERKAFVFAWTFMPRDKGEKKIIDTLGKLLSGDDLQLLKSSSGVSLRALAIRLLLIQQAREHDLQVKLYHHALYKHVMNTLIMVFSRGVDLNCTLKLGGPQDLLNGPCCVYDGVSPAPRLSQLVATQL